MEFDFVLRCIVAFLIPMIGLFMLFAYTLAKSFAYKIGRLIGAFALFAGLAYTFDFIRVLSPIDYSHTIHMLIVIPLMNLAFVFLVQMIYELVRPIAKLRFPAVPYIIYIFPLIAVAYSCYETYVTGYTPYTIVDGWHIRDEQRVVPINVLGILVMYGITFILFVIGYKHAKTVQYRSFFRFAAIGTLTIVLLVILYYVGILRGYNYFVPPTPGLVAALMTGALYTYLIVRLDFLPTLVKRYALLMESSPTPIVYLDAHTKIIELNTAASNLYHIKLDNNLMAYFNFSNSNKEVFHTLFELLDHEGHVKGYKVEYIDETQEDSHRYLLIDGSKVRIAEKDFYYCMIHDLTTDFASHRRNEYFAFHDTLTGLHNRTYFEQMIPPALRAMPENIQGALILCDLNFFKAINDTYGHQVGDQVLCFTAQSFEKYLPQPYTLARLGGDEFIIFYEVTSNSAIIAQAIDKVRQQFRDNHFIQDAIDIEIIPSFGIAYTGKDGTNYDELYKICDARMYEDKKKIKERRAYADV